LNISDKNALRISERKVIWKIYGPVCEDGAWRVRSNSEINSLLQGDGHVKRMESERAPKCLLHGELFRVRRRGRPRKRWLQDVMDGLRQMIGKWIEKAQERNTRQLLVKETKAHQGL
jgi:hypothetical protein